MKVFPNWPLLELFCFCPKRDSGKDTEGSGFALWFLLVLWLSTGHPLFIVAQCVPWWPWKMGRVYKAKQDLCWEDLMIFWSTFGSYRKQQSSHHYHCTESSSSWGKVYFSELLHSVSLDDEPHSTGKQLLHSLLLWYHAIAEVGSDLWRSSSPHPAQIRLS